VSIRFALMGTLNIGDAAIRTDPQKVRLERSCQRIWHPGICID
jgi:hypothetical protein